MVQTISRGGGDFPTKVGDLCVHFSDMGAPFKTQVENGLIKLFDFRGWTIDVSDQSVFVLKDSGLRDEEGKKANIRYPLTTSQRRSGHFFL